MGVSLSALASRTHYSKALLGHLETGERAIRPEHVRAYEEALGVRVNVTDKALDLTDVELIGQAVDVVTAIGLRHGGFVSLDLTATQAEWARSLLGRTMPDDVRSLMSSQVARLVDRWAWSFGDIGRAKRATDLYGSALSLAADDPVTRGAVMVNLANHYTMTEQANEALTLLEHLDPVVPVVDFTAESARARAYATLGDWELTVRHIDLADDAHSRVDLATLPVVHMPFVNGHHAHADYEAGKALALLAEQGYSKARTRAVERLSRAHSLFGPDRAQTRMRCEQRLSAIGG
jgi:hypothetical protein